MRIRGLWAIVAVAAALGASSGAASLSGCSQDPAATDDGSVAGTDASVAMDMSAAVPDIAMSGMPDASRDLSTTQAQDGAAACPPAPSFNFACNANDPATCPGGFCILGQCIGQQIDPATFKNCGDGVCDKCESAATCKADCAPATTAPKRVYDDPNTITVWLHGFTNHNASDLKTRMYGAVTGCGDIGDAVKTYKVNVPCATDPGMDKAPNQVVAMEYYGAVSPPWMSAQDIKEVEAYPYIGGATGLQRYGLIVAKFIKWRMEYTGATHVNLGCHSMGCLLSRYVIENDLEQLASSGKIVRWVTSAGVVSGAQLARLYNNPLIQQTADQIGLAVDDFALMEPSYVQAYAAVYDHKLWEGNNPLFGGMLIHHLGATDPHISQALGVQLLNLNNPQQMPNDGIMYTFDEMFKTQSPAASLKTPSGEVLSATHTFEYAEHQDTGVPQGAQALFVASLYHKRKVFITLESVTLKKDHEFNGSNFGEVGSPPGEVVAETKVTYDPYTMPKYGTHTVMDDDELAYWSPEMWSQTEGSTLTPKKVLLSAPIFDDQASLHLNLKLTETDNYVRFGCNEAVPGLNSDKNLLTYDADVPLTDGMITYSGDGADITLRVHVVTLY